MKKIAIVGAGPTGIYTLFSLLQQQTPLSISIFEQADEAGVGMPYSDEENSKMMLANIASIEIPPIYCTYLEWLQKQEASHLQRYGVKKETLHDRQFLPRILLEECLQQSYPALKNLLLLYPVSYARSVQTQTVSVPQIFPVPVK